MKWLLPGVEKINSKCCCLFIFCFNVTTSGAPGCYVTPNTAMQTAVMWGYVSCSVAVYKYGALVVWVLQVCATRYPREQPIISPLNVWDQKKSTVYPWAKRCPLLAANANTWERSWSWTCCIFGGGGWLLIDTYTLKISSLHLISFFSDKLIISMADNIGYFFFIFIFRGISDIVLGAQKCKKKWNHLPKWKS